MKDTIVGEWKFSEQISYEQPKLKSMKSDKMWKNRKAYKKRKFKYVIKFKERNNEVLNLFVERHKRHT